MNLPQVHLSLCVQDSHIRKRAINVQTMEGLDRSVEVFGFNERGEPMFLDMPNIYYRLSGGTRSGINLNGIFNVVKRGGVESGGQRVYARRDGKLVEIAHVYGFEALSVFLGMKGCAITAETVEKEITGLLKGKATRIYCFRSDELNGLQSYRDKGDKWLFSAASLSSDDVEYDSVNELLKKLGSPWRILTDASLQALRKSEFKKLIE